MATKIITARVQNAVNEQLKALAERDGMALSTFVTRALNKLAQGGLAPQPASRIVEGAREAVAVFSETVRDFKDASIAARPSKPVDSGSIATRGTPLGGYAASLRPKATKKKPSGKSAKGPTKMEQLRRLREST